VQTGATLAINAGGAGAFTGATSGAGSIGGLLSGVGGQGAAVNYTGNVTLGIDTTGGNVTYAGAMTNVGTTLGLHKLGSLRLTLSGNNTFTGATTVSGAGTLDLARVGGQSLGSTTSVTVNSGATLLLTQSDQVNDAATVTLSGGTIRNTNAGGIGETFGNLNLTAASFLDFGNGLGNNVMNFGTYAGGGFKLTVQDFAEGNVLTFKTDLTSTINNTSLFDFSNAFTSGWNSGTSTFTITAIPEPSTYVAALGLAGLILWPLRRRVVGLGRLRFR
jgi:autotransporter-associated beta strand protein